MSEDILPIGMEEMNQVFDVIDNLEISRESIQVELLPSGEGSIEKLATGKIKLVLPATTDLASWLPTLVEALQSMELHSPGEDS